MKTSLLSMDTITRSSRKAACMSLVIWTSSVTVERDVRKPACVGGRILYVSFAVVSNPESLFLAAYT